MTLKELTTELGQLKHQIKTILAQSQYCEYNDLSGVEYDRTNAEALLLICEYRGILWKLSDIEGTLSYLQKPVAFVDTLTMNESGQYETTNGEKVYTSGSGIEFSYQEEVYNPKLETFENVSYWRTSHIEHNGERYYIVGYASMNLDGLTVRVRR